MLVSSQNILSGISQNNVSGNHVSGHHEPIKLTCKLFITQRWRESEKWSTRRSWAMVATRIPIFTMREEGRASCRAANQAGDQGSWCWWLNLWVTAGCLCFVCLQPQPLLCCRRVQGPVVQWPQSWYLIDQCPSLCLVRNNLWSHRLTGYIYIKNQIFSIICLLIRSLFN